MVSKILIQVLCLSLALFEIKAFVRPLDQINKRQEYETLTRDEVREPHHHYRHHHRMGESGRMSAQGPHMPPPPGHDLISQLFQVLAKRLNNKRSKLDSKSSTKLETESKAKAYVVSKWITKTNEEMITNNRNNESKVLTRNIDQSGETSAVFDFNSDLDLINSKVLKAKSDQQSRPAEEMPEEHRHHREHRHKHHNHESQNRLNRYKREAEGHQDNQDQGGQFWGAVAKFTKQVATAAEGAWKTHIEPKIKQAQENLKKTVEKWTQKNPNGQGGGGGAGGHQNPQTVGGGESEAPQTQPSAQE